MTFLALRHCVVLVLPVLLLQATVLSAAAEPENEHAVEETISYLDNGQIRVGANLSLGGSITYLAAAGEANMINSHDWGRQIQMSFYSGPNPFAPGGKQPAEVWAGLGWNPIQSGDCAGNRSRIVEHRNDGQSIYVKCIPMQWPLDNEPGECTFESWIRLEGKTVHVRSQLNNARSDTTQYSGRSQELPAVYTNGPWYRVMSYVGDRPFTGGELTRFKKTWTSFADAGGSPWEHWRATENWAALVDDNDHGVGVFHPGAYSFVGGFFGVPGKGGSKDAPTGYLSPLHQEILDHNIVYQYEYVLIVGTLDEIRQYVYAHTPRPAPPDYLFEKDRQHWVYRNATDEGWPIRGELHVRLEQKAPQLIAPAGFWQAAKVPNLYLTAACRTQDTRARLLWTTHGEPRFSTDRSLTFELVPDGEYRVYELDLASTPGYRGAITGIRLDPVADGRPGDYIKIKSLSWKK